MLRGEAEEMPPVILREPNTLTQVRMLMETKKINYTEAKPVREGIKVTLQTKTDFGNLTKTLDNKEVQYTHTD